MNLDQLLDPQRLARIWAKKAADAPAREREATTRISARDDTTRADTTRADTTRADTTRADTTRADTVLDPRAVTAPTSGPDASAAAERAESEALTRPVIALFEDPPPRPVFKLRPGATADPAPDAARPDATDADAGADARAPEPASAERALDALETEVIALFGRDGQDHALVRTLLDPMREAMATDGAAAVKAGDIDDLEDLLDAVCSARHWPMGNRSRDGS